MNPKSFSITRGALSEEEPEAVDMSLDSPDSPEEAGANARSPSPDPDYEPEEEADMLLDQAAIEVKMDSPEYIAPGSRSPSIGRTPSPIAALFHQVHGAGTDSHTTPGNQEESRKRREEEGRRRSRARLLLDQVRSGPESKEGGLSFKDPPAPGRRSRAVSEEWVCICKLCKLYPGRECDVNWPRRVVAPRRGSNGEGEKDKPETRRFRSALTWNPPRKRSISPQGGAIRCKSPHLCRNAAAGRSMTPENRGRSPTMQEKLARWPRVDSPEKERLSRAWSMMEREQRAISDTREPCSWRPGRAQVPCGG